MVESTTAATEAPTLTVSDFGHSLSVPISVGIALLYDGFIGRHEPNAAEEAIDYFVVPHDHDRSLDGLTVTEVHNEMWRRLLNRVEQLTSNPPQLRFTRGRCTTVCDTYLGVYVDSDIAADDEWTDSGNVMDGFVNWCDADNRTVNPDLAAVLEDEFFRRFPNLAVS